LLPATQEKRKKCSVIGEGIASSSSMSIPSGQSRAFDESVEFRNLPPLKPNEWSWTYSIDRISARN
jgi:hypothetical protein